MKAVKLPPLPKRLPSQLGPIKVRLVKRAGKDNLGRYDMATRVIEVISGASRVMQWQTLYHELAHAILSDAGLHNAFTHEQQEVLCDVFATARVAELMASL
jgi:Zn-dependent peptidase ImmA (M78 family)